MSDKIVMMSNGPAARVGQLLEIDLPRPRDRVALSKDAQFNKYRQEVLSFLYEKKGVVDLEEVKKQKKETQQESLNQAQN